jgi:autotransporter-associated beta strand protein
LIVGQKRPLRDGACLLSGLSSVPILKDLGALTRHGPGPREGCDEALLPMRRLYARGILLVFASLAVAGVAQAQQLRALGLDVSAWQTEITATEWNTLKRPTDQQVGGVFGDGRDFVFIRSSRGGTTGYYDQTNADNNPPTNTLSQRYDDPYFVQNITRATSAGLFAGPYHFSRPDVIETTLNSQGIRNSGADEANHFMQMAGPWMRPGYLLPVHDLEAADGIRSDNDMAQFALDFSNRIYEAMGIRPAIYLNGNYAQNVIGGASSSLRTQVVQRHPTLWIARWPNQANPDAIPVQTAQPNDSLSWIYGPWDDFGDAQPWSFWQYASTMKFNGNNNKTSNTDANVANGGLEFLKDHLVPALWINDASGEWTTLSNWNSGQTPVAPVQGPGQVPRVGSMTLPAPRLPGVDDAARGVDGQNDTVILDRPTADITVTLSSGEHAIRKLYVREALHITGGALTVNYAPSWDSTPFSAKFSAPVSLSGGSLSVHALEVDATRRFTLGGGALNFNSINLLPHATLPAELVVTGDVSLNPLAGATATIAAGGASGNAGRVDLAGGNRVINIGDGSAEIDVAIDLPIVNGGLTKTGAGAMSLAAANTYAGDTIVQAGTLRLGRSFLANAADVYLSSGSTLELDFTGAPDVIDALFIDGVSQLAGTWGAVGSGAQHTSPLMTGTGLLEVTAFVAPMPGDFNGDRKVDAVDLAAFRGGFGMTSAATAAHGDADGDGDVDGSDFLTWQRNFGAGDPPAGAIPEPAGFALVATAATTLLRRRARLRGRRR